MQSNNIITFLNYICWCVRFIYSFILCIQVHKISQADINAEIIFNCQMGRGRTTTGMVIATLIYLNRIGASGNPLSLFTQILILLNWLISVIRRSFVVRELVNLVNLYFFSEGVCLCYSNESRISSYAHSSLHPFHFKFKQYIMWFLILEDTNQKDNIVIIIQLISASLNSLNHKDNTFGQQISKWSNFKSHFYSKHINVDIDKKKVVSLLKPYTSNQPPVTNWLSKLAPVTWAIL